MTNRSRLQSGNVIVELVDDRPYDDTILLTVSKRCYDEDAVQISLPSNVAKALGYLLVGKADD